MRNIKYSLLFIAVALFSIAASSCQKDCATLKARFSSFVGGSKVYVNNFAPIWNGDEEVVINNDRYQVSTVAENGSRVSIPGVLTAAVYNAVYPADFFPNGMQYFQVPRVQEYVVDDNDHQLVKAPMGAYCTQANPDLVFTPMGSLLDIKVKNEAHRGSMIVDSISVEASAVALWGAAQVNDLDLNTRNYTFLNNDACHRSVIACLVGNEVESIGEVLAEGDEWAVYAFVPHVPSNIDNKFTVCVFAHVDGDNSAVEYKYTMSQSNSYSGSIPCGNLAEVPFSMNRDIEADIAPFDFESCLVPGEFYVSETKKVRFSKGNLQYQASTNTWRFAEHQYDFVGGYHDRASCGNVFENDTRCANNYISSTYSGWIDLFGYATSGINNYHLPYQSSGTNNNYSNGLGLGGSLSGNGYQYDWGYNSIINGGNCQQVWHTLTILEWNYLLVNNTYGLATITFGDNVDPVYGLVIVPGRNSLRINPGITAGYSSNVFTNEQWLDFEQAGALFLPAAGLRNQAAFDFCLTGIQSFGRIELYYWSSSYNNPSGCCLICHHVDDILTIEIPSFQTTLGFHMGASVRLCKVVDQ